MILQGVAPLHTAGSGDLAFFAHPRYRPQTATTQAGALLISPDRRPLPSFSGPLLLHPHPYLALALLLKWFHPSPALLPGIHPTAWVDPSARVHSRVEIGPGAILEEGVEVGEGSVIGPQAVLTRRCRVGCQVWMGAGSIVTGESVLGDRVRIGEGAVIGSSGFGYLPTGGEPESIPQVGRVVLEEGVEIGAGTTIDRATLGETRIGAGTKIDNLVQVGHNVVIGRGALIAAQSGIAGSTQVGDRVMMGGQVGVVGHLHVGEGAKIGAGAGVASDVPAQAVVSGGPAFDHRQWRRAMVALPRLPELLQRVQRLEARILQLESNSAETPVASGGTEHGDP